MSGLLMGLVWGREIKGHEREVLLAMADHAHDDGSSCYPSIPKLAWKVGISDRTVQRIIAKMVEAEVLELVEESSHHRANEYRIDISKLRAKPSFRGDRGDKYGVRGDKTGVTGVTKTGGRGDTIDVTLTVDNHHIEPIEPTTAPAAEQVAAENGGDAPATKTRKPRALGPWAEFRDHVLTDYGLPPIASNQALVSRIIKTAEYHELDPDKALMAWSAWRDETLANGTRKVNPAHLADKNWGAWIKAIRDRLQAQSKGGGT